MGDCSPKSDAPCVGRRRRSYTYFPLLSWISSAPVGPDSGAGETTEEGQVPTGGRPDGRGPGGPPGSRGQGRRTPGWGVRPIGVLLTQGERDEREG